MGKTRYPQGPLLIIRECMKAICLRNSAATKLLSVLMYWYDYSSNEPVNGVFRIRRKQTALVKDMIEEANVTTIHSVAIPFLQLLGYLDIEGEGGTLQYLVYVDKVQAALDAYSNGSLLGFLNTSIPLQLQKFGIELSQAELPKVGFDSRILEKELPKVVIANKKFCNCKRGRKPKPKAVSEGKSPSTENSREIKRTYTEREENSSSPHSTDPFISQETGIIGTPDPIIPTEAPNVSKVDQLRLWLKDLKIYASKDQAKEAADLALLVPHIQTISDLKALYTYAKDHIYGPNKTVFLGNLAGCVEDWVKSLDTTQKPQENAVYETMNYNQADNFAQRLIQQPGFSWDIIAIDQPWEGHDIWTVCIQYAPGEWLPFGSEDHFDNPSDWERDRIQQAIQYGQSLKEHIA